ncbi:MAG TPA: Fic family protein, partial [Mariniflexile sp.]
NLMRVRTHNDISQWLKFFLTGIIETAQKGVKTFDGILQLQKIIDEKIKTLKGRSTDAKLLIEYLYTKPIVNATTVAKVIDKSPASAYKLLRDLEALKIIEEVTGAERSRLYMFRDYLNLFTNKN